MNSRTLELLLQLQEIFPEDDGVCSEISKDVVTNKRVSVFIVLMEC